MTLSQGRKYSPPAKQSNPDGMDVVDDEVEDLGWKSSGDNKRRKGKDRAEAGERATAVSEDQRKEEAAVRFLPHNCCSSPLKQKTQERRTRLLKELAARLNRDKMLRYTERELEMQKLLMGKGASKKLQGVEKVEEGDEDERDSDDERRPNKVDEKAWKPRVYKWRVERKR